MFKIKSQAATPLQNRLQEAGKQIPYALSLALNEVAFEARSSLKNEILRVFDKPTKFTHSAALVDKATKAQLQAVVYLREDGRGGTSPADYLAPQIEGGGRRFKGLEVGLHGGGLWSRLKSKVTGSNLFFLPASGTKLDANGNVTKAFARRVIQETKRKGGKFFLFLPDDGGTPLIMERGTSRRDPKVVFVGVRSARYQQRLKFDSIVDATIRRTFEKALETALDKALPKSNT